MRRSLPVLALLAASGTLAACGSISSAGAAPGSDPLHGRPLPAARNLGSLTSTTHYRNVGITLEPPAHATAAVSATSAYRSCASGDSICPPGKSPTIHLALATAREAGTARADGSIKPVMDKSLVYVLTFTDIPCVRAGGPPGRPKPAPQACTIANFVDAHTGKVLYAFQSPNP